MEDTSTIPAAVSPHVASLAKSFALVPPAAASAVVDCVLASSGLHPSDLFHSLLLALPDLHESSNSNQIVSHTAALCYLVKDDRTAPDALQLLIWRVFLPLLRAVNVSDSELLIQLEELLCDVVSNTRSLELAEATVVPFCLRSIGLSVGMFNNEELAVYQWSCDGLFNEDSGSESVASAALPLPIACCVLTSLLETALRSKSSQGPERELVNRFTSLESFAQNLIWDLSAMALGMLMQSPELRSCAVRLLLPHIFRSFHVVRLVKVSVEGSPHMLTRICFLRKIWKCCLSLFLLGRLERLDAYNTLSLCFSSFDNASGSANVLVDDSGEAFEIGEEKEFWEEIQRGLVDKDSSVRKQALYILKISLSHYFSSPASGYGQSSCVLEITSQKKNIQTILHDGTTSHAGVTKRGRWAEKEAKSLGVGEVFHFGDHCLTNQERWKVFLLLYEMLEEYGTHLVEAAWTHQVSLLFQYGSINNGLNPNTVGVYQVQMGSLEGIFSWLAILWERGLFHGNPQVRCLIMQSFLGIAWEKHEHYAQKVPMNFILGPFILGLNDVVQHKDFGVKGVYTSETIQGAMRYLCQLSCRLSLSERRVLVFKLASVVRQESFGRAGLMALAYCISSAACQSDLNAGSEVHDHNNNHPKPKVIKLEPTQENALVSSTDLLDVLGIVMERSKQHFNSNYRSQVCKQVLKAAACMIGISDVPLDMLLHFLSIIPREFTDFAGPLRGMVQLWLSEVNSQDHTFGLVDTKMNILMNLTTFPTSFVKCRNSPERSLSFNDEDVGAWGAEAQRWARVLFLVTTKKQHLEPIFMFLKNHCSMLCDDGVNLDWVPIKLLILILCLVEEFEIAWRKYTFYKEARVRKSTDMASLLGQLDPLFTSLSADSFIQHCFLMLEDLLSFAKLSSQVFWSVTMVDMHLPCSIKGKLGGPSQRRLAPLTTSAVLQAIISVRTLSSISPWYTQLKRDDYLDSSFTFLWDFTWNVIQSSMCNTEFDAELCLAAYEALSHVFKAFSTAFTPFVFDLVLNHNKSSYPIVKDKALLDPLLFSFLESVNNILGGGLLKRSRRAVLLNWKWLCLDSLMLIPYNNIGKDAHLRSEFPFFSDSALQSTFVDIVESLENAGESSVLPMLRSVRSVLGLLYCTRMRPIVTPCAGVDHQIMLQLVHSSWILHLSCNKRRVAPIAALLSAALHPSVFSNLKMHETNGSKQGPLKWFIEKLLAEGEKSPRMIRLAALHLTGLWFLYPKTVKYYIKELKLLSQYGSVAFDEDFEAEVYENPEARTEVSFLAQNLDSELTEVFINTEMYARVSVAVLFYKLADLNDTRRDQNEDCMDSLYCGKMFLLELLDFAVTDKDLSKELYKKYSGVHRRKVRVWQMICILSHFVDENIVKEVTSKLHICLYRNNLPAVRQYMETFAINIYLKFPMLAKEQMVPIFYDYNMKPQAISSYVFIAANVIIHAKELQIQTKHLSDLIPPIIPFLTSHHHSLRGFTQLLVHYVLCKLWPALGSPSSDVVAFEKKCFEDLRSYLAENVDCVKLRASMEGFLDFFDPITSATPAGVFNARNEVSDFECVPMTLMEQVIDFLNDVRDDLRSSIAKDAIAIKNESLAIADSCESMEESLHVDGEVASLDASKEISLDFQKKITLYTHETKQTDSNTEFILGNAEFPGLLSEMEKEDFLLSSVVQSRNHAIEKIRGSCQEFILVASLIDRIPNLAGLARTCEVFKAAGLAIADASLVKDKQFQLISVTAEKWVPIIEVPVNSMKIFLEKKRREGFSILGLEQTANSTPLDQYSFPQKMVLVLGREKEGIPVDIIHVLDACVEIPQLGIIRSLNVHVSGAIALWEYTRQQRFKKP